MLDTGDGGGTGSVAEHHELVELTTHKLAGNAVPELVHQRAEQHERVGDPVPQGDEVQGHGNDGAAH